VKPMLDLRVPIGALSVVIGALLVAYGLTGHEAIERSLAMDRWWGTVMVVCGLLMLAGAWRAGGRPSSRDATTARTSPYPDRPEELS
jgi:hypothetical protein